MVVVAIIGLLAAIALPNFTKARDTAQINAILSNLRVIDGAKDRWALENKKGTGDPGPDMTALSNYIRGKGINDVSGEAYTLNNIGTEPIATIRIPLGTYAAGSEITAPPF